LPLIDPLLSKTKINSLLAESMSTTKSPFSVELNYALKASSILRLAKLGINDNYAQILWYSFSPTITYGVWMASFLYKKTKSLLGLFSY